MKLRKLKFTTYITLIGVSLFATALFGVAETKDATEGPRLETRSLSGDNLTKYGDLLKNYKFKHSIGLVKEGHGLGSGYEDYFNWGSELWDTNGVFKKDITDFLEKSLIFLPKYNFLTSKDDKRIKEGDGAEIYAEGSEKNVRRQTHVTEHTIYAIPGQSVLLYPYSDFDFMTSVTKEGRYQEDNSALYGIAPSKGYEESCFRWYDYSTDEKSPYLTFSKPKERKFPIFEEKKWPYEGALETPFGHLGGKEISTINDNLFKIRSEQDYYKFVQLVNKDPECHNLNADLLCDLDFENFMVDDEDEYGNPIKRKYTPFDLIICNGASFKDNDEVIKGDNINDGIKYYYSGTFNGNGHTIKNLKLDATWDNGDGKLSGQLGVGMFGRVSPGMRVTNLIIDESCEFKGKGKVGLIGVILRDINFRYDENGKFVETDELPLLGNDSITIVNVLNRADLIESVDETDNFGIAGGIIGSRDRACNIVIRNSGVTSTIVGTVKGAFFGNAGSNGMVYSVDDPTNLFKIKENQCYNVVANSYTIAKDENGTYLPFRGNGNLGGAKIVAAQNGNVGSTEPWVEWKEDLYDGYRILDYKGVYNCFSNVPEEKTTYFVKFTDKDGNVIERYCLDNFKTNRNGIYADEVRYLPLNNDRTINYNKLIGGFKELGANWKIAETEDYSENTEFENYNETENKFYILNVEDYLEFVKRVNGYSDNGKWIEGNSSLNAELLNDLDFSGIEEYEIDGKTITYRDLVICYHTTNSKVVECYQGTFNGNGHTIRNLVIDAIREDNGNYAWNIGLIGRAFPGAKILNLILDESCRFIGGSKVGLIGSVLNPDKHNSRVEITNVINKANFVATENKDAYVGGMIGYIQRESESEVNYGYTDVLIRNSAVTGIIKGKNAGGFYGFSSKTNVQIGKSEFNPSWFVVNGGQYFNTSYNTIAHSINLAKSENNGYLGFRNNGQLGGLKFEIELTQDEPWASKNINNNNESAGILFRGLYDCVTCVKEWKGTTSYNNDIFKDDEKSDDFTKNDVIAAYTLADSEDCDELNKRFEEIYAVLNRYRENTCIDNNLQIIPIFAPKIEAFTHEANRLVGAVATYTYPKESADVNESETYFEDQYIAMDISHTFTLENNVKASDLDDSGNYHGEGVLTEPIVTWRHIFNIKDGRQQAHELCDDNAAYIKKNTYKVSARAGADFQFGLDMSLPDNSNKDNENIFPTAISNRFYIDEKGDYKNFESAIVETYKSDGTPESEVKFYLNGNSITPDGIFDRLLCCDKDKALAGKYIVKIFASNDGTSKLSGYKGEIQLSQIEVELLNSEEAHLVPDGIIYNYNAGTKTDWTNPLSTNVPNPVSEQTEQEGYEGINPHMLNYTQEYMDQNYTLIANVDFDNYYYFGKDLKEGSFLYQRDENGNILNDEDGNPIKFDHGGKLSWEDYFEIAEKDGMNRDIPAGINPTFYKWPLEWDHSSYGFGYKNRFEYSMYVIVNNSWVAPYHNAVNTRGSAAKYRESTLFEDYYKNGLYDRLYYRSKFKAKQAAESKDKNETSSEGGNITAESKMLMTRADEGNISTEKDEETPKGFFYYVNAAGDPGTMSNLHMSNLCPGAKLYVSAWVAELTGTEPETCNIIFNFVANLKDGTTKTLHRYVTGSIKSPVTHTDGEVANYDKLSNNVEEDDRGKWMHVYYSFIPDVAQLSSDDIVDYSLILENNAKNSHGSDYAFDDLRVYMGLPEIKVAQNEPLCEEKDGLGFHTGYEVGINYESLKNAMGIPDEMTDEYNDNATDKELPLYYTFINKEKYEKWKEENKSGNLNGSSEDSNIEEQTESNFLIYGLKYDYDFSGTETLWGTMYFHTRYSKNLAYDCENTEKEGKLFVRQKEVNNESFLVFNTYPQAKDLKEGATYYVVLYMPNTDLLSALENIEDQSTRVNISDFDVEGECCKKQEVVIGKSLIVSYEGVVDSETEEVVACINQRPELNVAVNYFIGLQNDEEVSKPVDDSRVDWYRGSLESFNNEYFVKKGDTENTSSDESDEEKSQRSLKAIMMKFRSINPEFNPGADRNVGWPDYQEKDDKNNVITSDEVNYLYGLWSERKLELYADKIYYIPDGNEDGHMVAIPFDKYKVGEKFYTICAKPKEITIKLQSPDLNHGFAGFKYPEEIEDVPLRIGLKQILACTDGVDLNDKNQNRDADAKSLTIPLRLVVPSGDDMDGLTFSKGFREGVEFDINNYVDPDPEIVLVGTNDGSATEKIGSVVAWLNDIMASKVEESQNYIKVSFSDKFKFREGYEYKLRFAYADKKEDATTEGDTKPNNNQETDPYEMRMGVCGGQHVFTIKVVPEYLVWKGGESDINSNNWNDDANWNRVTESDLMISSAEADNVADHIVSDKNDNFNAYHPLDFTKVIIPPGVKVPELYLPTGDGAVVTQMGLGNKVYNLYTDINPHNDEIDESKTENVQFDMVAFYHGKDFSYINPVEIKNEKNTEGAEWIGIGARPWYMNTCDEIHFKPHAEIGKQRLLNYNRAWVEMKTEPDRWYTLSSPLQGVVAGDFYLPTSQARQSTPLFKDITFNETDYHRFKPAVFQRGWAKAKAYVYEVGKNYNEVDGVPDPDHVLNGTTNPENVIVNAVSWSRVYNDVLENYGKPGNGFSVKTDVTGTKDRNEEEDNSVIFRFPKADTSYEYYGVDYGSGSTSSGAEKGHKIDVKRVNPGRLHDVEDPNGDNQGMKILKVGAAKGGEGLFFVGNPFMAHLDMKKFLEVNTKIENEEYDEAIEPKYWIMTGDRQTVAVMTNPYELNGNEFISTSENPRYVAPMQGFFVKIKNFKPERHQEMPCDSIALVFTEDMSATVPYYGENNAQSGNNFLLKSTRGMTNSVLSIKALKDGETHSEALIRISQDASRDYSADEEAVIIVDAEQNHLSRVYSVAGNTAVSVNSLPDVEMTEIGLIAGKDSGTVLRFEGVDAVGDTYLVDKLTGQTEKLYEGMEYSVNGPVKSRLYLTRSLSDDNVDASGMSVTVIGNEVNVTSSAAGLDIMVSDMQGRIVKRFATGSSSAAFELPVGLYVVKAQSGSMSKDAKIVIGR